jgi:two-component system NtrC family response regulator
VTSSAERVRLLFVEDEVGLRQAYQRYFQRRFEVAVAGTGESAQAECRDAAPDLVILDLKLPDADGMDVLRTLRDLRPGLPVIITTSYASQQPVFEMLGIPHQGYLVKPFSLGDLERQIDAVLT